MSCNISIFAKEAFLNINPHEPFRERVKPPAGHLLRVSSMIRGNQIAEHIGAKFNPTSGYQDDVCIYVKPMVRKGDDFNFEGKPYLDIIDGHNLGGVLDKHHEVTGIVCSKVDYETMSSVVPNKFVYIPQHHCNFERVERPRTGIKTLGMIGTREAFDYLPRGLGEALEERGVRLLTYSKFFSRQDIINFYLNIDLQVVWRPYKKRLSNPLKIVNASSFGIPTVALDEKAFGEVKGCYLPVDTFSQFLAVLDALVASPSMYNDYCEQCLAQAEYYHIDNVGQMYKDLCTL